MPCSFCKLSGHNKTTCYRRFVTEYHKIRALMNLNIVIPCSICKVSGHDETTCPDRLYDEEISALMNINVTNWSYSFSHICRSPNYGSIIPCTSTCSFCSYDKVLLRINEKSKCKLYLK